MKTPLRNEPLFLGALMSIGITLASSSSRADCTFPSNPNVEDDAAIMSSWDCWGQRSVFWNEFEMDGHWDGYGGPCDLNLPLARTYSSIWLLQSLSTVTATPFGRLAGAYNVVVQDANRLEAVCDANFLGKFYSDIFIVRTRHVEVSKSFFYDITPAERAAVLVHESRHRQKDHDAGSNCPRGESCDSSWSYDGANTREVQWLSDFLDVQLYSFDMRVSVYSRINYILSQGFQWIPNLKKYSVSEVYTRGLVELCYPNCPPPPPPDPPCGDLGLCGNPGACFSCGGGGGCAQAMPQIANAYPEDVAAMGDMIIACP